MQDALPQDSRGALLLSGGLDSSVVAALAAPARSRPSGDRGRLRRAGVRRDAVGAQGGRRHGPRPHHRRRSKQREPLDAAEAYLRAWELPLPTPGILIEAPLIAAAARLEPASCSTARAATSSSAPPTSSSPTACGACDRCRPGGFRAGTRGWATTRRCVTSGACSRASASAGRSRRRSTSRSAGDGPRRATPPAWLRPGPAELYRDSQDPWRWKLLDGPRWWASWPTS